MGWGAKDLQSNAAALLQHTAHTYAHARTRTRTHRTKVDGLGAKDLAAALLHTREAIRLAQDQKQVLLSSLFLSPSLPLSLSLPPSPSLSHTPLSPSLSFSRCWLLSLSLFLSLLAFLTTEVYAATLVKIYV